MPAKLPFAVASAVTFLLVLVVVAVFGFGGIVTLNGFMNASAAVYTGFACLGITLIVCPILAWILAKTFTSRFSWSNILAVVISVFVSTFMSGVMGFVSMIVMVVMAEAMW